MTFTQAALLIRGLPHTFIKDAKHTAGVGKWLGVKRLGHEGTKKGLWGKRQELHLARPISRVSSTSGAFSGLVGNYMGHKPRSSLPPLPVGLVGTASA